MPEERREAALRRLEADGLVRRSGGRLRTTRRWQSAMARTAFHLVDPGNPEKGDLRIAIATALVDLYGCGPSDEELADLVEVLLPIEAAELAPQRQPRA